MQLILQFFSQETIFILAVLLVVILIIPILFERLKLPGLLGLVGSGVILGDSGWNLLQSESPIISLLSDIGLSYLVFIAGLEFNIKLFRQCKTRSLVFSCFTFSIPLIFGTFMGLLSGFSWSTSILIGCLISSHTPLAYPILMRLGLGTNEAINVAIGATIFSNLGTLIILAVFVAIPNTGSLDLTRLITILIILGIYASIVLIGFDRGGKEFFRRYGDDESKKFLFVFLSVFITNVIAQFLEVEKALSFFLAGLLVSGNIGEGPVKEKLLFIGSAIFIPIFLIDLGLFIDLPILIRDYSGFKLFLLMIFSLIFSKFISALLVKKIYHYNWQETFTIWSLSIPLLYTTLVVGLEGYRCDLLPSYGINSVILLMLITSTVGPWLTGLITGSTIDGNYVSVCQGVPINLSKPYLEAKDIYLKNIIVHIHKSQTYQYLIELSALLTHQTNGKIVPLAIASATAQMDAPQLEDTYQSNAKLLEKATIHGQSLGAQANPLLRIDQGLAPGITRAAREQQASLIVIDWGKRTDLRAGLFGNVIDSVLWSAHCPVAVARLVESPKRIQRILVPMENLVTPTLGPLQLAQILADANQAQVTLLNVCDRHTSTHKIAARRSRLSRLISQLALPNPPDIQIILHENVTQAILQAARLYDLVVLPFTRNPIYLGGLVLSDITTQLAKQLTCSMIILGEPQNSQIIIRQPSAQALSVNPDIHSYQNTG